jgi:hypothetical protein
LTATLSRSMLHERLPSVLAARPAARLARNGPPSPTVRDEVAA